MLDGSSSESKTTLSKCFSRNTDEQSVATTLYTFCTTKCVQWWVFTAVKRQPLQNFGQGMRQGGGGKRGACSGGGGYTPKFMALDIDSNLSHSYRQVVCVKLQLTITDGTVLY